MSSTYSVFVPRMFSNIREDRIVMVFNNLKIGNVNKVDLVSRTNKKGESYNMAFIHFNELYNTESANIFKHDVENPNKQAIVVYEDPWFWVVLPFKQKEPITHLLNPIANVFIPPSYSVLPGHPMTPIWTMTPQGPMWHWGYKQSFPQMVPPQVMYGNKIQKYRRHPKRRINLTKPQPHEETPVQNEVKEEGECV
jgi:hypothetical protein